MDEDWYPSDDDEQSDGWSEADKRERRKSDLRSVQYNGTVYTWESDESDDEDVYTARESEQVREDDYDYELHDYDYELHGGGYDEFDDFGDDFVMMDNTTAEKTYTLDIWDESDNLEGLSDPDYAYAGDPDEIVEYSPPSTRHHYTMPVRKTAPVANQGFFRFQVGEECKLPENIEWARKDIERVAVTVRRKFPMATALQCAVVSGEFVTDNGPADDEPWSFEPVIPNGTFYTTFGSMLVSSADPNMTIHRPTILVAPDTTEDRAGVDYINRPIETRKAPEPEPQEPEEPDVVDEAMYAHPEIKNMPPARKAEAAVPRPLQNMPPARKKPKMEHMANALGLTPEQKLAILDTPSQAEVFRAQRIKAIKAMMAKVTKPVPSAPAATPSYIDSFKSRVDYVPAVPSRVAPADPVRVVSDPVESDLVLPSEVMRRTSGESEFVRRKVMERDGKAAIQSRKLAAHGVADPLSAPAPPPPPVPAYQTRSSVRRVTNVRTSVLPMKKKAYSYYAYRPAGH